MLFKRIVTITLLLVSGFGSVQAMASLDETSKERLKNALEDLKHYKAFEEQYKKVTYDVDRVTFNKNAVGGIITARLQKKEFRKPALAVAKLVQGARTNEDIVFQTLYTIYESDPTALEELKSWLDGFEEDVDAMNYAPGKTIGARIKERLTYQATRKQELAVAKLVQGDRSNKVEVFQTLYTLCKLDQTALAELENWIEEFKEDVDKTADGAHPGKTIGEGITELLANRVLRKEALAVARLVQSHRSNKDVVFQTLYTVYEKDKTALEDLESWVKDFEKDVDKTADLAHPGKTIGERITELLKDKTTRKDALAIAMIVQDYRSNEDIVFQTLYKAYESDPTALKELQSWFDEYEGDDVDKIQYNPAKAGKTIGERIAARLSKDKTRKDALAVAKLVQGDRSDKESVLRTLYTAYEKDQTVFADLKEWQEFVNADITAIRFDPALPETIAQRIEALKRDDLTNLFKITATAQPKAKTPDDKKAKWSIGKTLGLTTLAAGAGVLCYYYYMNSKDSKNEHQTLAA